MHKFGSGYVFSESDQQSQPQIQGGNAAATQPAKVRREGTFSLFGQQSKSNTRWRALASAVSHETHRRDKHYASMATLTAKLMDSRNKDKSFDKHILRLTRDHDSKSRMQRSDSLSTINSEVIKVPNTMNQRNKNLMTLKIFGSYRKISLQNKPLEEMMDDEEMMELGGYMTEARMMNFKPIEKFRKAARLVTFLLKIKTEADRKYKEHKASLLSFAQLQQELEEGIRNNSDGLMFDPKEYKAVKEVNLSVEVINILSLSPGTRSEEQKSTALAALKSSVPAFGEYPLRMQQKLVSVGWYESFEAKRVIIRQGHPAENFYFILSGTALVTILTKDPKTGEESSTTVAVLSKGSSFGELALLHHKTRSATVVCKDEVALLAVGREDFRDLFMSYEEGKEVEHISFLKTIPYLQGLPLDNLASEPNLCIFHYFRRGIVIVKNSLTEWIYFIKSGSCRVLTQISKRRGGREHSFHGHQNLKRVTLPSIHQSEADRKRALYAAQGMGEMTRADLLEHSFSHRATVLPAIRFAARLTMKEYHLRPSTRKRMDQERAEREKEIQNHRIQIEEAHVAFQRKATQPIIETPKKKEQSKEQVFVQIELLKPKDQFGLNFIQHDSQAIKCHLVSNGAECILISKQWFLANASEDFIKKLRGTIFSYPSLNELQRNYKIKENWDTYRTQTLNTLVDTLNL